jgi:hypothetical protein
MSNVLIGFEEIKTEYFSDPYFNQIIAIMSGKEQDDSHSIKEFYLLDGFLFKCSQLCTPFGS